jgi:hypothetical protein
MPTLHTKIPTTLTIRISSIRTFKAENVKVLCDVEIASTDASLCSSHATGRSSSSPAVTSDGGKHGKEVFGISLKA